MRLRYRWSYFDIEVCFRGWHVPCPMSLSTQCSQTSSVQPIFCVFQEYTSCTQALIPFCWQYLRPNCSPSGQRAHRVHHRLQHCAHLRRRWSRRASGTPAAGGSGSRGRVGKLGGEGGRWWLGGRGGWGEHCRRPQSAHRFPLPPTLGRVTRTFFSRVCRILFSILSPT